MSQDISKQIDTMRRRLQGRHVFIATCWLVVTLLTSILVLAAIDWLLGVGDVAGRIVVTLTLIGLASLAGRRWLTKVWRRRFTSVSVAQSIEQHHPELRDIVTSALHFNQQLPTDTGAGSESLRRAVVLRAGASVEDIDYRQLVSPRALRRAMLVVVVVGIVVVGFRWQAPVLLNTGFTRLFNPLSTAEWPRENNLQFIDPPTILVAGDDLLLKLRDTQGLLPAAVTLQTRTNRQVETQTFATSGNSKEIRLSNIKQSLEYRATGGDHASMRWHKLNVITPPRAESIQVTVFPPEYTNMPKHRFETGESLLAGSRLQFEGKLNRQAASITLRGVGELTIPALLENDGMTFRTQAEGWQIESPTVIAFEITTTAGLKTTSRHQLNLETVTDQPPRVTFAEPIRKLSLLPTAVVTVVVDAQDDLAVRDIQLVYYRQSNHQQADEQHLAIYQGPEKALLPPAGQHQRAEHQWHLKTLDLIPGDVLEVHAQASDYQPTIGQTGAPLRLTIVSETELLKEIAENETKIIERLQRLQRQQIKLRDQTVDWKTQSNQTSSHWEEAINQLLARQRRLANTLHNDRDGIMQQLERILADFQRNGLARPDSKKRLQTLHQLLDTLVREPLPTIEQILANWLRDAQFHLEQVETGQHPSDTINSVVQQQDEVIKILQQAIELATLENTLAQYENEIAALQKDQQQLADQARQQMLATSAEAKGEKKSNGQEASNEQRNISRKLAKLVKRMSRSAKQQLSIAGQLTDVVTLAQELGVQATMHSASDHLGKKQFGQAITQQQQAIADLQEMRKRLTSNQAGENNQSPMNTAGNAKDKAGSQSGTESSSNGKIGAGTNPKESVESPGNRKAAVHSGTEAAEDLVRDLWGHLPARQRDQILQPLREEFLPKYAPEIEAYFRALAEPEEMGEK